MTARLSIIGGYLGSGKSTLVNILLGGALPGRTAVVVNDFGSVNVDADLIVSADEDTIELTNGCICCQLTDDVSRTMSALAARDDLDQVLCEVSGVGDPGELSLWRDFPGFSPGVVAVCADVTAVRRLLRDPYVGDTVQRQLHSAEVVLLTKLDLASEDRIAAAGQACAQQAPHARLVRLEPADRAAAAAAAFAPVDAPGSSQAAPSEDGGAEAREHRAVPDDDHRHTHASSTLPVSGPVPVDVATRALTAQAHRLVRAKGTLRDEAGAWYEIQLASGRVDVHARNTAAGPPAHPGLVLITGGRDPHGALREAATALADDLGVRTEPGRTA